MEVDTGGRAYRSDPSGTAVVSSPVARDQGRLFNDPGGYSFADTDQLPAVNAGRSARYGAPRGLRVAVVAVLVVILAAGVALALVEAGVIGGTTSPSTSAQTHTTTPPTTVTPTKDLLTPAQTFAGSGSTNFTIPARAFKVTVTTGPGQSWVSIGVLGQTPIYEGILAANSSQSEILLGPGQISVGAGGTKVIVTSGRRSQTLLPPSAPFSYQITPGS